MSERETHPHPDDPRVFFAAERTLLAWLRTALAIIGLGFLVSRFGLFLSVVGRPPSAASPFGSVQIGIGLVILGGVVVGLAAFQHARFTQSLSAVDRPRGYWMGFGFWVSLLVLVAAVLLAAYLIAT